VVLRPIDGADNGMRMDESLTAPPATVVIPTFNEEACIRQCLDSLRAQDAGDLTFLVVDGGSTDATRSIVEAVAAEDPRVRLIDNPKRMPAAAMNVGIGACTTEYLVRADAHALYEPDFVRRSLETLIETGAVNAGGPMRPQGTTPFGRAVAAVTTSRVGIGWGAFHFTDRRRDVDTVYLGCWRTETLRNIGGYDEHHLSRAGEDMELNFRLRKAGGRIVCDPSIRSTYFPRSTPGGLWRQYWTYGTCKATALIMHRRLPSLRPLAPALLVLALVAAPFIGGLAWLAPAAWLLLVAGTAVALSRRPGVSAPRSALALAICHLAYGIGFWAGLSRGMFVRRV
jgi:succinoglycan biosynthesis protein ExoA